MQAGASARASTSHMLRSRLLTLFKPRSGLLMKSTWEFVVNTLVGGLLVVVPIYLAVLLLLKAMKSVAGLVRPVAMLLPPSLPAEHILSLLLVLAICFLIGLAIRSPTG